jgi:hypothetical protein
LDRCDFRAFWNLHDIYFLNSFVSVTWIHLAKLNFVEDFLWIKLILILRHFVNHLKTIDDWLLLARSHSNKISSTRPELLNVNFSIFVVERWQISVALLFLAHFFGQLVFLNLLISHVFEHLCSIDLISSDLLAQLKLL